MNQKNNYLKEIKELIIAELSNIDILKGELKLYVNNAEAKRAKGSILHDFYNEKVHLNEKYCVINKKYSTKIISPLSFPDYKITINYCTE